MEEVIVHESGWCLNKEPDASTLDVMFESIGRGSVHGMRICDWEVQKAMES